MQNQIIRTHLFIDTPEMQTYTIDFN